MRVRGYFGLAGIVALSVASMMFVSGCDKNDDNSSGSGGKSVVGTWSTGGDSRTVFRADGTWDEFDDPQLTARHLGGTYTQSGNHVSGTGVNPGVGDLEIDGTVSDDAETLQLDFIEHWHTPYKHNPATLVRM